MCWMKPKSHRKQNPSRKRGILAQETMLDVYLQT